VAEGDIIDGRSREGLFGDRSLKLNGLARG